jgi:hypothetical protein
MNGRVDLLGTIRASIAPSRKEVLLRGLGDIGTSLPHEAKITTYEKAHTAISTLHSPLAMQTT